MEDSDLLKSCMESAYSTYPDRMGGIRLPPMDVDYASKIEHYPTWVVASAGNIMGGLMNIAETEARERDYPGLHLATHVLLDENLSLYRHLGWTEIDRDETRVFMRKCL